MLTVKPIHWLVVVVPVMAIYLLYFSDSMEEPAVLSKGRGEGGGGGGGGGGVVALQPVYLCPDHLLVIGYLSDGCLMVMQTRRVGSHTLSTSQDGVLNLSLCHSLSTRILS